MKIFLVFAVILGVSLIGQSDAYWGGWRGYGRWGGYGGYGLGYGGYGYGLGYIGYGGYGGYGIYGYSPYYGYGYGYSYPYYSYFGKRDIPLIKEQIANRTECMWLHKTSMLHCSSPKSVVVDCPTVFVEPDSSVKYLNFGMGRLNSTQVYSNELFYSLYPRKLDESAYVNDMWIEKGKEMRYALYYGDKNIWYGFRITDKVCFKKLFELFRESIRNEEVLLKSDLKENQKVNLFGELYLEF